MAKKQFKAESKRLLDLMIHSIYSNREIFLREILSNASDAIDKLCYRGLTDREVGLSRDDFYIEILPDREARTITVRDNGIGMDRQSLEENLGTIASSGSLQFKKEIAGQEGADDTDIIGQFGVGFYSAFIVSDKVTVITRPYGSDVAYKWVSSGADGYTITECARDTAGTDVIMHLKEDTEDDKYSEFLEEYRLRSLVKKYSDYIRWPIKMMVTKSRPVEVGEGEDKKTEYEQYSEVDTLNSMVPIWHRPKSEVTSEEYADFYREKCGDFEAPLTTIRVSTEGLTSYEALLFIPARTPYNYYSNDYQKGLQLYSSGVLIMENCADLLPEHFRFVKGVVDSPDVSLNISREMLQQDRQVRTIATNIEKKIRRELEKLLESDREKYESFFAQFGLQLKYGTVGDYGAHKDQLRDLLLFYSSTQEKPVTLKEYVARMPEDQKEIYYACGDSVQKIANLPQTEAIRDRGWEILYLTDEVDEFVMQILHDQDGKELKNVNAAELPESEEEKKAAKEKEEQSGELLAFLKETLKDKVSDVQISSKLKSHPVFLSSTGEVTLEMEKYFAQMKMEDAPKAQRVLELGADHPMFNKLQQAFSGDRDRAAKLAQLLYQQASLIAGFAIEDPTAYTDLVCELL
ncbi:molecular chaperone HtpG [Neobittarella massiliensis]|uniref:Chaperone protein HtpG n=1 Tax=Neobittarella massiliensis (ex Bilen et al. 2018) TaxID=2041842 RepID=A0A8J6IPI1_9FIRM|nr:molecular chaperone HtpG [Neobittarella massiliensis]MBC3515826.1 molecular chaperone HtpG [Neobittarella massiliensis]